MAAARPAQPFVVALTGATGSLGRLVLPRLLASESVAHVVALGPVAPPVAHPKLDFATVELTRPSAAEEMASVLTRHKVRAVVHLAFLSGGVRSAAYARAVEVEGTRQVLTACVSAKAPRVVVPSTTLVYGASPKNPNYLPEGHPLAPARLHHLATKREVEDEVSRFAANNPRLRTAMLRFAPVIGPTVDTLFTRYLGRGFAPVSLGYDPLVQCVHEDDAADAVVLAAQAKADGAFNVVGHGVLPLSTALRIAGTRPIPLPAELTGRVLTVLESMGIARISPGAVDYLRYLWVASGDRAESELDFRPRFSCREAILSYVQARRG